MTERIGQQLGNYRVLRLLGRGGFADVYLGEHVYLSKPAALKVLRLRLGEQETEQFLREARTLARLEHPHIVRVLDFAVQDGLPFLVMDYALRGTLRTKHPAGARLPLDTVVSYVDQVASALQYAHDQRLLHHDVKPENMLLDAREQVLLADFGLALLAPATSPLSTQAIDQPLVGTAPYLAPEQLRGRPLPASDQYALGVIVYEWLTGERPFREPAIEIALQHVSAEPASLCDLVPGLPPAVEEVVLRVLAKEPERRFPSVQDFATALQHAAHPAGYRSVIPAEPAASAGAAPSVEREQPAASGDWLPVEPCWKVPTSFTSLVGREQDVAAICILLARPEVRLLTLLGVGGIGKTRLAIQVASQLRERFVAGVCFVGLATIRDPSLVISAIAHELGLQEGRAQPLEETVTTWLRDKHFLLLLDNFEQVVSAAPLLEDLLSACPGLVILVTSREVLRLSAEQLFPVPPLAVPDLIHRSEQEELAQYGAVALFLERARAIRPAFHLTPGNARPIAEICTRLDGLPLAIELAAARMNLLSPQALLARLSHRLQVLTGGVRDAPARQQTLRNTLQWSYDLLTAQEQRLFRRLCVFVGGCTLEAVEACCSALGDAAEPVVDRVASLIDKSLMQQSEQQGGEPRFAMLEMVHEYGLEVLSASGELEAIRQAHGEYYLQLTEQAALEFVGPQEAEWHVRLEQEHGNLRAAMQWSLERGHKEIALRLGAALRRFWQVRGYYGEGRRFLERALAASEGVLATWRAKALYAAAVLAWLQNDLELAEALCGESLQLYRELGDQRGIATTLYGLGRAALTRRDHTKAQALADEALGIYRELGDKQSIAYALESLVRVAFFRGDYARARSYGDKSLTLAREIGDNYLAGGVLLHLARMAINEGDQTTGQALLEEGLVHGREFGYKLVIAQSLSLLGQLALNQGDAATARSLAVESLELYKELGDQQGIAESLSALGMVEAHQGDLTAMRPLYEESLAVARKIGDQLAIASSLEGLAEVFAVQGRLVWATQLWGAVEAIRNTIGATRSPTMRASFESRATAVRARLGEQAFAAAWAEGRTMTPEQALAAQGTAEMPLSAPTEPPSTPPGKTSPAYPAGLTAREVEVLRLVAQGLSDAHIAEQLVISPRTVNWHLTLIYSKLGVSSRAAATRYAIEHQVV
jgi:predicted ATPase/DNA-binding CsgD family transcriptional regulator